MSKMLENEYEKLNFYELIFKESNFKTELEKIQNSNKKIPNNIFSKKLKEKNHQKIKTIKEKLAKIKNILTATYPNKRKEHKLCSYNQEILEKLKNENISYLLTLNIEFLKYLFNHNMFKNYNPALQKEFFKQIRRHQKNIYPNNSLDIPNPNDSDDFSTSSSEEEDEEEDEENDTVSVLLVYSTNQRLTGYNFYDGNHNGFYNIDNQIYGCSMIKIRNEILGKELKRKIGYKLCVSPKNIHLTDLRIKYKYFNKYKRILYLDKVKKEYIHNKTKFMINPYSNENQLFCLGVYIQHSELTCDINNSMFMYKELLKLKKEVKHLKQQLGMSDNTHKKIIVHKEKPTQESKQELNQFIVTGTKIEI